MTTVIIHGETKKVYTDSRRTCTQTNYRGEVFYTYHKTNKINKLVDGTIIVGAGQVELIKSFFNKFGLCLPKLNIKSDATIAVVNLKGDNVEVSVYKTVEKSNFLGLYKYKFWEHEYHILKQSNWMTFGSGGDYAHEALNLGKSPEEAIIYASTVDQWTDAEINISDIE